MMNAENEVIFCIECKDSIECCFCSCPFCGEITKNCHCNLEKSRSINKILSASQYSKLRILRQSKKASVVNTKEDDWWRLEKWQIGRSKFP